MRLSVLLTSLNVSQPSLSVGSMMPIFLYIFLCQVALRTDRKRVFLDVIKVAVYNLENTMIRIEKVPYSAFVYIMRLDKCVEYRHTKNADLTFASSSFWGSRIALRDRTGNTKAHIGYKYIHDIRLFLHTEAQNTGIQDTHTLQALIVAESRPLMKFARFQNVRTERQ